jgi:type IX secretion system PorP/SprF family membrane protein
LLQSIKKLIQKINMKKVLLSVSLVITGVFSVKAQQDIQLTQHIFDRLSFNPGFTGIDGKICATGIFRQQWSGFTGSPQTILFNAHGPVNLLRGGVGLSVFHDKIGFFSDTYARLSYSYHLNIPSINGKLGIGLSAGLVSKALNPTWVAIDPVSSDNVIPDAGVSQSTYDIAFGLYYKGPDFYVGLSSTRLTESDLSNMDYNNKRHYHVIAGWEKQLNTDWMINPYTLIKSDIAATQFDIGARVVYGNMVWLGLNYRLKDAIMPMLGYQMPLGGKNMPGMIRIGYSYDITTSQIKQYSNGSHEIMLNYCFNLQKPPTRTVTKTVRFL